MYATGIGGVGAYGGVSYGGVPGPVVVSNGGVAQQQQQRQLQQQPQPQLKQQQGIMYNYKMFQMKCVVFYILHMLRFDI